MSQHPVLVPELKLKPILRVYDHRHVLRHCQSNESTWKSEDYTSENPEKSIHDFGCLS